MSISGQITEIILHGLIILIFKHQAVFVLFFVQKVRQTIEIVSFLEIGAFSGEKGQQKTRKYGKK